jgi:two-component system LytT family response regulator
VRALIVDDERLARAGLRRLLEPYPDLRVVAEADSVDAAEVELVRHRPDVIFLDIAMPGGSGFDLLVRRRVDAQIVFVTAYDEHAVRAFEVNALDYLLKPVDPERLAMTIDRLRAPQAAPALDRLCVTDRGTTRVVAIIDVVLVRAHRDHTELVLRRGEPITVRAPLTHWETRLGSAFVRVHRSTLVSIGDVIRLERTDSSAHRLFLRDHPHAVPVSRAHVGALRARLRGLET